MKSLSWLAVAGFIAVGMPAGLHAKEDPVRWTLAPAGGKSVVAPGGTAYFELKATVDSGWHLYSPTTPPGGPIITKIQVSANPLFKDVRIYRPQPVRKLDPNFQIDTETYTGNPVFIAAVTAADNAAGQTNVETAVRYQVCSDVSCLPPVKKTVNAGLAFASGTAASGFKLPDGYLLVPAAAIATTTSVAPAPTPSSAQVSAAPVAAPIANAQQDLLPFLLTAFGFGLASLFTPCVFPMIPITVSFFINQGGSAGATASATTGSTRYGWMQALVFCSGIVVLFTSMGFLITAIAGPFGVVQLGSSPWVNGFIALVFFTFGLSLLGAFELTLPSGLLTKLNSASQGSGYLSTLLMGLTFSLTSFACIGPIVGPLLIASVQDKGAKPILGMMAFAMGLALPFFLLALFPSYLRKLPRSGGWMVRVKVVLGFIVLAVMLKYLSNVDQVLQTHWLMRERFLAAWIVLFALPGLYLLGFLSMEGIKRDESVGVSRALIASLFLIFAVSLAPGLFGARLGDLDAFVPEGTSASSAAAATPTAAYFKNDLAGALAKAREENKLVLVNFTGYACTNCHWMKANMFTRPEIQAQLKDFVIVDLFTDGTDADSEKNQKLEDQRFGTAAIPFYAILDKNQSVVATFPQLTRDSQQFLGFLQTKPKMLL
jgi:thiol:disulfide interchange protein DsbD